MASPGPVPAQMVGNAFVTQYYNVLHQMPHVVYRFYTDASRLTRAEAGSTGETQTAVRQDEIHKVFRSMDHTDCRAEILTVDALDSFGGSVFVLVTGAMHKNNSTRKFVQSFFLAPQDRGYYVLNDIFRYLDEETQQAAPSVHEANNGLLDMYERLHIVSEAVPESSGFASSPTGEEELVAEELEYSEHSRSVEQPPIEDPVSYQTTEVFSSEMLRPVEQVTLVADVRAPPVGEITVEKKSYASILRLQSDNYTPSQGAAAFHPANLNPEKSFSSSQHRSSSQLSTAQTHVEPKQESFTSETEVDNRSVYVNKLPANTTDVMLEEELGKFGPIRSNSISVRSNKDGGLYAFVDFEDSSSAQAAIEATYVLIGGRKVHIEGRKSTYAGGRGRGRGQGRGTLQNNGSRARGTYSSASGRGSSVYGDGDRNRGGKPVRGGYASSNMKGY